MRQASQEKQLPKCKTDNFGQEPFTYDVSMGEGGKKSLTKRKKMEKKSGLREEEGGRVKLQENQAEVICNM